MKEKGLLVLHWNEKELRILNFSLHHEEKRIRRAIVHSWEGESKIAVIKRLISSHGLKGKGAVFVLPTDEVFFTNVKLPPMSKKEVYRAVENEIKRISPFKDEFSFSFMDIGIEEIGEQKVYLAAALPNYKLEELLRAAEALNLTVETILWSDICYQYLVRSLGKEIYEKSYLFIHLKEGAATFAVIHRGSLLFSRNLTLDFSMAEEELLREINLEALRAVQFFKQATKKAALDEAFIISPSHLSAGLASNITSSMGITATNFLDVISAGGFSFPELSEEELNDFLVSFADLLGATAAISEKEVINLLPENYLYKRKLPKAVAIFLIQIVAFSALFLYASLNTRTMVKEVEERYKRFSAEYKTVQLQAEFIEKIRNLRKEFWKKYLLLNFNTYKANLIGRILRDFAENAPVNVVFDLVQFEDRETYLNFTIKGAVIAEHGEGNRIFLNYFNKMKTLYPDLYFAPLQNLTELDDQLSPFEPIPKVKFTIKGKVEVRGEL